MKTQKKQPSESRRVLKLTRERLRELAPAVLEGVVGGAPTTSANHTACTSC